MCNLDGTMADDLDSIVKGAPLPGRRDPITGSIGGGPGAMMGDGGPGSIAASASLKIGDPLSHTPSSPSMIYLNLLILEASLRAQYLALRARRRHHTFFLLLLGAWITGFGYGLFLAPREDGSGVGGSVYWVVDVLEKVCFMGGVITAALVWATGIWDRGVRWPRRWFSVSNRGLRHINCKLVLLKRPWYAETLATVGWFLTYGLLSNSGGASYRYVEPAILREVDRALNHSSSRAGGHSSHSSVSGWAANQTSVERDEEKGGSGNPRHHRSISSSNGHEEDLAPGGDYVKLLLLAKPFSPTFRENWEIFRQEYWERENERRALVRQKLKEQDRELRRSAGVWFWWLPGRGIPDRQQPAPRLHHPQHPRHAAVEREHKRTRSNSMRRGSTSMGTEAADGAGLRARTGSSSLPSSSRSGTPTLELEDPAGVTRKSSTGSTASTTDRRRKKSSVSGGTGPGGSNRRSTATDSRSVTPDIPSPLARESSVLSSGSASVPKSSGRAPRAH